MATLSLGWGPFGSKVIEIRILSRPGGRGKIVAHRGHLRCNFQFSKVRTSGLIGFMLGRIARNPLWPKCHQTIHTLPTSVNNLLKLGNEPKEDIELNGWVQSIRKQKRRTFLAIGDGSNVETVQAVLSLPDDMVPQNLTYGASVRLGGSWSTSPGAGQAMELQVKMLRIFGGCDPEVYPIQRKALSTEHLRDHAHLRSRYPIMAATLRLRNTITSAIHEYFNDAEFTHIHTPIITSNDCEGAGETFEVQSQTARDGQSTALQGQPDLPFFRQPAFLTVSHQLHLEAITHSFPRVYTLSPCFRAETSQTSRHLSEFYMLEAELAFIDTLDPLLDVTEGCVKHAIAKSQNTSDWAYLWKDKQELLTRFGLEGSPWLRITYDDAITELKNVTERGTSFAHPVEWGMDLRSEHEKWLVENLAKGPVFVTDYPEEVKPFYMLRNPPTAGGTRTTVANFDLLVPHVLELAGGSLRTHGFDELKDSLVRRGLWPQSDDTGSQCGGQYDWYLDIRKYGSAPHGGFGLGFDRLVSWIGGIDSVKDCMPMPRWAGRMLS